MALVAGGGTQAQFNHPDLGGMGQWSQGGMIMVGDMFNNALKYRVDALCNELSGLLRSTELLARPAPAQSQSQSQGGGASGVSLFVPGSMASGTWWPGDLGAPGSTGSQNNLRYAFFPMTRRLAIDLGGAVTVYDTGEHQISGFSQQQSGDQSLTFTSQYGLVRVSDLPVVGPGAASSHHQPAPPPPAAARHESLAPFETARPSPPAMPAADPSPASTDDVFGKIERLAALREKNIITAEEFETKKAELLSRL
jgi:Short C-terminal domain